MGVSWPLLASGPLNSTVLALTAADMIKCAWWDTMDVVYVVINFVLLYPSGSYSWYIII